MTLVMARRFTVFLVLVFALGGMAVSQAAATPTTAAQAQYAPVHPITNNKPKAGVKGATKSTGAPTASKPSQPKTSGLPFTGTSLLVPVLLSLVLIGLGAGVRRRFRARARQS